MSQFWLILLLIYCHGIQHTRKELFTRCVSGGHMLLEKKKLESPAIFSRKQDEKDEKKNAENINKIVGIYAI